MLMADMISTTFAEVRRTCKNPLTSSSRINRAFWMVISGDKKLKKRVMEGVCDFLKHETTICLVGFILYKLTA